MSAITDIKEIFAPSRTNAPHSLKTAVAELILQFRREHDAFGFFLILGWKQQWNMHVDLPDAFQDLFGKRNPGIVTAKALLAQTLGFDGAVLVDPAGNIVHSGAIIEGLRPRVIAEKMGAASLLDLSMRFGFRTKVHMRHISAIASSYAFSGTTVFTVSEETGAFHIFEGGRIVYSTIPEEMAAARNAASRLLHRKMKKVREASGYIKDAYLAT